MRPFIVVALVLAMGTLSLLVGCTDSASVTAPCADAKASSDWCIQRDVGGFQLFSARQDGAAFDSRDETSRVEDLLAMGLSLAGASPVHLAVRGTAKENSARCDWRGVARTPNQRAAAIRFWLGMNDAESLPSPSEAEQLFMSYVNQMDPRLRDTMETNFRALARGGVTSEAMFLSCYVDYTVHEYVLGSGATEITIAIDDMGEASSYDLYVRSHSSGRFGDLPLMSEGGYEATLRVEIWNAETLLDDVIEGREGMVFLAPMGAHNAIAVEAWQAVAQWDLQLDDENTVHAVRYGTSPGDAEHTQTFANLKNRIIAAASSDAFADDRIANASGLTQYYRDIGAYGDITPDDGSTATFTPAQPPPAYTCANGAVVADTITDRALVHDCEALLEAEDTLAGSATLDWGVDSAITGWEGVTAAGTPSRVTKLLLSNESLSGTVPSELGRLFELTHLNLSSNSLTGDIPRELGWLDNLQEIRLSGNLLTGCIPVALKDVPTNDLSSLNLLYCSPPAPKGLTAASAGENSVNLSWTAVSDASKYRVEYRLSSSGEWVLDDDTLTGTARTVDELNCENEYLFRVSAYGSGTTYAAAWSEPSEILMTAGGECVPPTFSSSSYSFSVPGDAVIGAVVGSVAATGSLTDDVVMYSIAGGDEGGKFAIDDSTGRITVAGDLNSSVGTSFTLTVEASDTSGGSATVTVSVTETCDSGTAVPNPASNPGLVADCKTLLGLKSALSGTATLNWGADLAMSAWEGVTLGGTPRRVTRLMLNRKGLTGNIPEAMGDLVGLQDLQLSYNQLTGSIPSTLVRLTNLSNLSLNDNQLTGPIPPELGALTNLGFVYLQSNALSGPIPPEMGSLTGLYRLWLQDNALTGPIPPEMGNLTALSQMWLSGNQLSGTIPAELTGLTNLTLLLLFGNPLVGCVPLSLKDIDLHDLNGLRLPDCQDGPPSPMGLSASLVDGAFTLTWTALSGVDEYEVQWRVTGAGDPWAALPAVTAANAAYTPTGGPQCSSIYDFRVRAHGDGCGRGRCRSRCGGVRCGCR